MATPALPVTRRRSQAAALLAAAGLLAAALWPFAAAAQRTAVAPPVAASPAAALDQLAGKARQPGGARILLEMRIGKQAMSLQQRRNAIQSAQDQVLAGLAVRSPRSVHRFRNLPFMAIEVDEAALRAAAAHPAVVAVHEDKLSAPTLMDSGPLIGAPAVWSAGYTGVGQNIAIIDTGVDSGHVFLRQSPGGPSKVVYEACFSTTSTANGGSVSTCPGGLDEVTNVAGAAAPCAVSSCLHGTHVAGIAAGNGANATPVQTFSGIAKNANLISIKVFSLFGSPAVCGSGGTPCALAYTSDMMRALDHLYDVRGSFTDGQGNTTIAAANMSIGGNPSTVNCDTDPLKPAIDQLRAAGIATVAASGNDGYVNAVSSPACISSAVSVGATTKQDQVAVYTNSAYFLNLLAPGSLITSSTPTAFGPPYQVLSGTSMAAPHVAGAFALLKSFAPAAGVTQILTALQQNGMPILDPGNGFSKPRIQVDAALTALQNAASVLAVTPADGLFSAGAQGGPFTPASRSYTLSNVGTGTLSFSASTLAPWATVSPAGGSLAANQSATVAVTIGGDGGQAAGLAPGTYGSTANFVNNTTHNGDTTRALGITVSVPVPDNDKFINAAALGFSSGNTVGTNVGASKDPGEPNHAGQPGGKSVWWRWTAPAAGQVTFDTLGSNFDTLLAAYTGSSVAALTPVASNDNGPATGLQSRIVFTAAAGTTYQIAVDGNGAAGRIALNWGFIQDIVRPDDVVITPAGGFSSLGPVGGAGSGFQPPSIVYTLTNTSVGARTFSVTSLPAWLAASPGSGSIDPGQSVAVTLSLNAAAAQLPPGSYSGTVQFNGIGRDVSLAVLAGNTINDAFVNRIPLTGSAVTATGSNQGASKEAGEPDHAGQAGGASAWWSWTAPALPAAQTVTIDTTGSGFDTLLGVYSGTDVAALQTVDSNDDQLGSQQSRVVFAAVGGATYQIAVDGNLGASGPIVLRISTAGGGTPSNDAFVNAAVLSGSSVSATGSNVGATAEAQVSPGVPEPSHAGFPPQKSVWWKWTPLSSELAYVDTFGSSFDTVLAVYVGSSLTPVASNDDFGGPQSRLSFQANAGTTYFIAVDGKAGAEGSIALRLGTQQPVPAGNSALVLFSQPGDFIGQGQTRTITDAQPNTTFFSHRNSSGGVDLAIGDAAGLWNVNFGGLKVAPGVFATLTPGVYENAVNNQLQNGLGAGMSVTGNGRGCNSITGSFEVLEANYATNGTDVISFAANFVQYCDSTTAAMYGQVRIGSSIPLDSQQALPAPFAFASVDNAPRGTLVASAPATISDITSAPVSVSGGEYSIDGGPFTSAPGTIGNGQAITLRVQSADLPGTPVIATLRIGAASAKFKVTTAVGEFVDALQFTSDAGDVIGQGQPRTLYAATGYTLSLSKNFHGGATVSIAGNGTTWTLNLSAPGGVPLAPGVYEAAMAFPVEGGQPGLAFGGEGRSCNTVTGRFEILQIAYGSGSAVNSLAANFEQHCEGAAAGLHGRVRVNSSWPLVSTAAARDYDGNAKADVFWLNTSTLTYVWQMNGATIAASGSPGATGDPHWQVKGIGDFNGDGKADILYRHETNGSTGSGATAIWLMNGATIASSGSPGTVADLGWQVQGVGDFDGDGKADILWMHTDGRVQIWFMNGTTVSSTPTVTNLGAGSGWSVQGIGDFDGDGKADILWRHTSGLMFIWLMNGATIASSGSPANVGPTTATGWLVQGVGDFDGDGKADILWRNDDLGGIIYAWMMNGTTIASASAVTGVGTVTGGGWVVKSIGDYDGDGKADVFWKNDTALGGITYVWLMNGASISTANAVTGVPDTNWEVQNPK